MIHFGAQAVLCSSLTLPDFQVFYRKWDTPFLHMFLKVMFKQWLWETDNCVRLGFVIIRSHSPANFDCNNSLYHIYIGVIKEHLSRTSIHIKLLLNKDVKQQGLEHSIIYAAYLKYNYLFVSCCIPKFYQVFFSQWCHSASKSSLQSYIKDLVTF